jgi:hypothetical protein
MAENDFTFSEFGPWARPASGFDAYNTTPTLWDYTTHGLWLLAIFGGVVVSLWLLSQVALWWQREQWKNRAEFERRYGRKPD